MPKKSLFEVPNPCGESWDEMVGTDRIRFCSHCSKSVNNISAMTRKEAMRLVNSSNGRLCVRYVRDPRGGQPLFAPRTAKIARSVGAAGVLTATLMIAPLVRAQTDTPAPVQVERVEKLPGGGTGTVAGSVTDPNGAAVPYAVVTLYNTDTNEAFVQNATAEGTYEFKDVAAGNYKIKFEGGGFDLREIAGISVNAGTEYRQDAQLAVQQLNETVQVGGEQLESSVTVGVVDIGYYGEPNGLVSAVYSEDLDEVKARVAMRAKINVRDKSRDGVSPLHVAVEMGNIEIARFLLEHGAKTNIRDFQKRTPLMMMDEDATPELFQLLVTYGAKPGLVDKERNNVLHHFARTDNGEMVRLLVQYGANPNAANKEGKTPLMIAAENDCREAVAALLESGADPHTVAAGRTAWQMTGKEDIRTLLASYGGTPVQDQ